MTNNTARANTEPSIQLKTQEMIAIGTFLILFGASAYSFFIALPLLREVDTRTNSLEKSVSNLNKDIDQLNSLTKTTNLTLLDYRIGQLEKQAGTTKR